MQRELPNLDWLRVFAATAGTESFALAADRLGVTPGAVSQRIKALEAFLGISLFQRYPQGVRLTPAGKRYAQQVTAPLEQLSRATRELIAPDNGKSVRATVLPALAQLWLGPRMDGFHAIHANATVEIWADPAVVDLRTSTFDIALRYGKPPFSGCEARALFVDELVPVAAPALARSARRDSRGLPRDAPLMLDSYWLNDFDDWLRQTGSGRPPDLITQTFSLYSMTVEAVVGGRGFMIGHTSLIVDLVAQGKLVPLSDVRVAAGSQFHLLTRTSTPMSDTSRAFADWILDQAGATEATARRLFGTAGQTEKR